MNKLIKELVIFLVLVILLAFWIHQDLFSEPMARWELLMAGADGATLTHPFLYAFIVYVAIGIVRLTISAISNFWELSKRAKKK